MMRVLKYLLLFCLMATAANATPPLTTSVPTTLQNTPCTAVQLLFGGGAFTQPNCLNLGTGLSITTGTLNATGAVAGPVSSVDGDLAVWNGTSGALLKDVGGSAYLDTILGSTQGSIAYRNATVWVSLTPGTSGYSLVTQGASANPIWSNVAGATGCTVSGGSQYNILVNNGSSGCSSDTNASVNAGALTLGASGTASSIVMGNATSGTVTVQPVAGALGSVTASLPANSGTVAEINLAQTWSALQKHVNADFALLGSSTGYTLLESGLSSSSNNTLTLPITATDTLAALGTVQTYTAAQTFTNSDLLLLGSSTGATTFTSDNATGTNYTVHVTAANDTIALIAATQTLTNKSISGPQINSGVVGATYGGTGINNGSNTLTLGGSLTTTGAATPTLAFGSSGFTSTFPTANATLAGLAIAETWTGAQTFGAVYGAVTAQSGTTYTLAATDCGTEVDFTNGSAVTVTIPATLTTGCNISILQAGAGQVAVNGSAVTPATLHSSQSYTKTSGQWAIIGVNIYTTGVAILTGDGA